MWLDIQKHADVRESLSPINMSIKMTSILLNAASCDEICHQISHVHVLNVQPLSCVTWDIFLMKQL